MDDKTSLFAARDRLQFTQLEMATALGMPLDAYEKMEAGRGRFRALHHHAALLIVILTAEASGKPEILPDDLADKIVRLGKMIRVHRAARD